MSPHQPTLLSLPTELIVEIISYAVIRNNKKEEWTETQREFEACKTLSTTCSLFRDILAPRLFRSFTLEYINGSLVGLNGLKLATSPHAQHVKLLTFDLSYAYNTARGMSKASDDRNNDLIHRKSIYRVSPSMKTMLMTSKLQTPDRTNIHW